MNRKTLVGLGQIIALTVFSISCEPDTESSASSASAHLESKGESKAVGAAKFTHTDDGKVRFTVTIESAEPGLHGIHIHEKGDCSSDDAKSAGGLWNPKVEKQSDQDSDNQEPLGYLGNIKINRSRTGHLTTLSSQWTIGDGKNTDVVGKAIVLHENEDNSGNRISCGVIEIN